MNFTEKLDSIMNRTDAEWFSAYESAIGNEPKKVIRRTNFERELNALVSAVESNDEKARARVRETVLSDGNKLLVDAFELGTKFGGVDVLYKVADDVKGFREHATNTVVGYRIMLVVVAALGVWGWWL